MNLTLYDLTSLLSILNLMYDIFITTTIMSLLNNLNKKRKDLVNKSYFEIEINCQAIIFIGISCMLKYYVQAKYCILHFTCDEDLTTQDVMEVLPRRTTRSMSRKETSSLSSLSLFCISLCDFPKFT